MTRILLLFAGALVFLSSCVPNKRIVYMQSTAEPKRGEVSNADTTARIYTTSFTEYQFRPGDIISLNIASITPTEFDFVKKYEEQLGLIRKLTQYDQANMSGGVRNQGGVGGNVSGGVGGSGGENGISALALDRMQTGFVLDGQGYLELPYIGNVKLAGLTIPQSEDLIKGKLKGYFETPVVRLQLLSFHYTILGEVLKEGRYTSYSSSTTIIDAITIANNLTDFADRSKIKVIRNRGNQASVYYVNTLNEDLLGQPGFYLQPDDIIIVPPLQARASRKYILPTYNTVLSLLTATLTLLLFINSINNK